MQRSLRMGLQDAYTGEVCSYFLSEHFADSRFERLHTDFENPLTELALLFSFLFLEM